MDHTLYWCLQGNKTACIISMCLTSSLCIQFLITCTIIVVTTAGLQYSSYSSKLLASCSQGGVHVWALLLATATVWDKTITVHTHRLSSRPYWCGTKQERRRRTSREDSKMIQYRWYLLEKTTRTRKGITTVVLTNSLQPLLRWSILYKQMESHGIYGFFHLLYVLL